MDEDEFCAVLDIATMTHMEYVTIDSVFDPAQSRCFEQEAAEEEEGQAFEVFGHGVFGSSQG